MSSFEWMELQTLASEITVSRSRLATARANRDRALVRALEAEITEAEQRRTRLLAQITNQLAATGTPEAAGPPQPAEDSVLQAAGEPAPASSEAAAADEAVEATAAPPEATAEEPTDPLATGGPAGEWDELTPDHLDRARGVLGNRRAEILARQAEELRELDADLTQLAALEQAIEAFARKFAAAPATADVVQLDEERELRMQNSA